jgi:flagellum-specific peptidoglycan hydrolase FlgJ
VSVVIGPTTSSTQRLGTEAGKVPDPSQISGQRATLASATGPTFAQRLSSESPRRVEAQRTPLTTATAKDAIAKAYTALTGETASDSTAAILTAQWAHETGQGASMFNYNFGGIKGAGPSGMTVAQRTREGYGENERTIVDSFRAYTSAEEGAKDYVHLLLSRFGSAMQAAQRGDASGFVRGLKEKGYFTGDPAAYERSVASIANQILSSTGGLQGSSANVNPRTPLGVASAATGDGSSSSRTTGSHSPLDALAGWREAPSPTALLALSTGSEHSASDYDQGEGLSAIRALQMSDEVTRAALRAALDDHSTDARGGTTSRR